MVEKRVCLKEDYRYRVARCRRTSYYEFRDCLGEGFEQKGVYEVVTDSNGKGLRAVKKLEELNVSRIEIESTKTDNKPLRVCVGIFYGDETWIRMFYTGNILQRVSIQYYGNEPKQDLKELRDLFKMVKLTKMHRKKGNN